MFVQFPVHSNIGFAVSETEGGEEVFLKLASNVSSSPPVPKTWTHPGFSKDPRQIIACATRARDLITRQVASSVGQQTLNAPETCSILSHMSRLVPRWGLIGYTLRPEQVLGDLCARGPVVGAMPVHAGLLSHISGLMSGGDTQAAVPKATAQDAEMGLVPVVILGWANNSTWKVALPWGKFGKSAGGEHAWDGTVHVDRDVIVNACGVTRREDTSSSSSGERTMSVRLMPSEWNPPTTRPLPANPSNDEDILTHGKVKHLKNKKVRVNKPSTSIREVFTDENAMLAIKFGVTCTIFVLAILSIVMLKSRRR